MSTNKSTNHPETEPLLPKSEVKQPLIVNDSVNPMEITECLDAINTTPPGMPELVTGETLYLVALHSFQMWRDVDYAPLRK